MYCKYCGKKIDDDSIYCSHCGKNISNSETRESDGRYGSREQRKTVRTVKNGIIYEDGYSVGKTPPNYGTGWDL